MLDIGFVFEQYADRVASSRYRASIPIEYIKKQGVSAGKGFGLVSVFTKARNSPRDAMLARRAKGHKVVIDLCDAYQGEHENRFNLTNNLDLADAVVCSTQALADYISKRYGVTPVVIEDPYEYPESRPDMPCGGIKLLWYGHQSNYSGFADLAPSLSGLVTVCTNLPGAHYQWSHYNVLQALEWCDIVLIPGNKTLPSEDCPIPSLKGANRLVEAVRRGRYVITDGVVEAYREYGMWRGDILAGIQWVRDNRQEALDQVRNAQSLVRAKHNPVVIAQKWVDLCERVGDKLWHSTGRMRG